jgi:predicted dehydrogenase
VISSRNIPDPLRIALIGCGQIADAHLQELAKIRNVQVVAVCDAHRDLAVQAAARFGVAGVYDSAADMLTESRPNVVHIATPAHTHFGIARECLIAGCHIYVEKPFTLNADEAEALVRLADDRGLKLCVGHDQLFDPAWQELRRRVDHGEIGTVRHVESVLGYPISGQFGSQVASDRQHWVRRLPGGLFQNTISHPLYRITEFLADEHPDVSATWQARAGRDFPTELFVQLNGKDVTATLSFVSTIAPQRMTRVYGEKGTIEIDLDGQTIRQIGPAKAPGAFCKLLTPWKQWRESARNLRRNLLRFLKAEIHYFAGLRGLSEAFYQSIRTDGEPPIPAAQIVRVTRLMDRIFDAARSTSEAEAAGESSRPALRPGALMEAFR